MKLVRLNINNKKLTIAELITFMYHLQRNINNAGFITEVKLVNSTRIDIKNRGNSFYLDRNKHDFNLKQTPYCTKRTYFPTWNQRVQFNLMVQETMDKMNIRGIVSSGPFIIKDLETNYDENDWYDQKPNYIRQNEAKGYFIESCNNQRYNEEMRLQRNEKAREKRLQNKLVIVR